MKLFAAFLLSFSLSAFAQESSSGIQIDVNQGKTKKSLIAFPPLQFAGNPATAKNFQSIGGEIFRVIVNDLSVSSYFQFIAQSAYLEDSSKTTIRPITADPNGFKFESWKQIGSEFLIRGTFAISGDSLTMEVFAYNVARGQVVLGKKYRGSTANARRIGHIFSNDFMEAVTGTKGMYLSKIVVASDRAGAQFKEVYTMDWDGTNIEKITNHKSITLSPAWSPSGDKVAYTAFVQRAKTKTRNADMYLYEIASGKRWIVSFRQGINSGAAFHPNGQNIYLTLSQNGSPDIYKMDLEGNLGTKVTNGPRGAMNVEPTISPDGSRIAFSSDRSGNPMIYVMNIDGSSPTRLTFAGTFNATPAWSPDGKKLAFAGWGDDHFDVFTMNTDGSGMIRITSAKKPNGKWAQNEDPVFSPDGRHLMYTSNRTGSNQIYISNLDGSEERRVTNDSYNYYKPKWSKNIE